MEFLQTYGLWILLAVGAVWFFARRAAAGPGRPRRRGCC